MIELKTNSVDLSERYRKDYGDIELLADSIKSIGLLHPIVVNSENKLICGGRRLRAFQHLGIETIPARVIDIDSILLGEYAENEVRKDFTQSERVAIAQAVESELGERRGRPSDNNVQNFAHINGQKTIEIAAEKAGFGNKETYRRAKKVVENGVPKLVDAMDGGSIAISAASTVSEMPEETQTKIVTEINGGAKPSEAIRAHVANNSGNNEWYTPIKYIKLARSVMGGIDLDPASSEIANKTVEATNYYTSDDDGLTKIWSGKVWMNPPYAQPLMSNFAEAISCKFEDGEIEQACILINNATETQWFQRIINTSNAVGFPKSRIKFIDPLGNPSGSPLQGQAIVYMGNNVSGFLSAFESEGVVLIHG